MGYPLQLVTVDAVHALGEHSFEAEGEPWLAVAVADLQALAGRFVTITYRLSLFDEPVRPAFRFVADDGAFVERVAPGPVMGAGSWTGRVPRATRRILVSPTLRPGPFAFKIESIRVRSWLALLRAGLRQNPRSTRSTVLTTLIGWRPEADNNLDWAIGAHDLDGWAAWSAQRTRPYDAAFDKPRFDWSAAGRLDLLIDARGCRAEDLDRTIRTLQGQVFPHWNAIVADPPEGWSCDEERVARVAAFALDPPGGAALTGRLPAGAALEPHALAYVAEQANRHPQARVLYGDTIEEGHPLFRRGWDERLERAAGGFGEAAFVRGFSQWSEAERLAFLREGRLPEALTGSPGAGRALRRILWRSGRAVERKPVPPRPSPALLSSAPGSAAIIIPTKDHPALLARVVASIRARPQRTRWRIAVVDNGSTQPDALALLEELRASADVSVTTHAGPFNFSLICNEAAARASECVLVFLNDDTEVRSADWLDRLTGLARAPGVGAVGAKLSYPDGRLQHVGVLLGMGGSAGHFGALAQPDDPGWMRCNEAVHAVTAVTGACLAVDRTRFEAVGGFDAEHLPVELSDIDLCLKLNARGWQTVLDPFVHLMHEESVSRGGATFRRLDLYETQRAVFLNRWRDMVRDDPLFHPGLSLYSHALALG